jgi:hypothetical protein
MGSWLSEREQRLVAGAESASAATHPAGLLGRDHRMSEQAQIARTREVINDPSPAAMGDRPEKLGGLADP